jgi:ferredoxin
MTVAPVTRETKCTLCGICADLCPTAAISVNGSVATRVDLCIRCCACIKGCPEDARFWEDEKMRKIANWLNENCSARKEPQLFGADG